MGVFHSVDYRPLLFHNSPCVLHKDFILKEKLNTELIEHNGEYLILKDVLYYFCTGTLVNLNSCPLLITITIQLLIRVFENIKRITYSEFKYSIIVCYRLAICLEYDKHLYEDPTNLCSITKINLYCFSFIENKVLKILNYKLYKDNIYNNIIDKNVNLLKYYRFICNPDIYLRSSKDNAGIYSIIDG